MSLIPVEEAQARILQGIEPVKSEEVALAGALGRTLADDLEALLTQPPWDTSSMDGYAVRAADVAKVPTRLKVIGAAPAGHAFSGAVGPGEAVRIFTGAPLPRGADTIVIQEDTEEAGGEVEVRETAQRGRHIRPKGLDFTAGKVLLQAGRHLGPRDLSLAAAMGYPRVAVRRRPVAAILATGDELVPPGTTPGPDQIIASNGFGIAGLVERAGGAAVDLGIVGDDEGAIRQAIRKAISLGADVLVTLGGASVGEHDLVKGALAGEGLELDFWRIAMRPGKPLMFGRLGRTRVLGLPGNPVSALVCSRIFLVPLIYALLGRGDADDGAEAARLATALPANDRRQDYLRAGLARDDSGHLIATPFPKQDSSMLATLARADCLVIRPPHAHSAAPGDSCRILRLDF